MKKLELDLQIMELVFLIKFVIYILEFVISVALIVMIQIQMIIIINAKDVNQDIIELKIMNIIVGKKMK